MQTGKLPAEQLKQLLKGFYSRPDVILGPNYGEDAAAVRIGGKVLVAASDPITFATDRIGYYAVSVNANDIASHAATPRWFLVTLLLPESVTQAEISDVFEQIDTACRALDVALIGGHTEITNSVDRIVVCGTMLGEVDEESLVYTGGAQVGDVVILAGPIAVEGTSILGREASDALSARGVCEQTIQNAANLLDKPGICVVDYARQAVRSGGVTGMHDPTEGGLVTALRELAYAAECGITLSRREVESAILEECAVVCSALGLDPLGLIASGSLIITAKPACADAIVKSIEQTGGECRLIGCITEPECGVRFDDGSKMPAFARDEIARYFDDIAFPEEFSSDV